MCGFVPGVHEPELDPQRARTSDAVLVPELGSRVLLAVDTSIGTSVALGAAGLVVCEESANPRGHAESIGSAIAAVLDRAKVDPADVSGVVVGMGPGLFTGLRIGIAAARAFALARGVPVLPVSGHEAIALERLDRGAAPGVRVVQDARRGELFVTEYASLDWAGVPVRTSGPNLVAKDTLAEQPGDVRPEHVPAVALVRLAARRLASGAGFARDEALYLRAPDARQPASPKRVTP